MRWPSKDFVNQKKQIRWLFAGLALLTIPLTSALAQSTLEKIGKSNTIALGYRDAAAPFAYLDDNKRPIGYSIDICLKIVDAVKKELRKVCTTTAEAALLLVDISDDDISRHF